MLTVKQAAAVAAVSPGLVYVWVETGTLTHYRVGRPGRRGSIRVAEADLSAFLESLKREKRPEGFPPASPSRRSKSEFKHLKIKH
jgi:excisionase family DNA binding protein